ncbi:hypothetical protein EI555_003389 [Monodon monoceros]|uniref:Phosphatidic acid phosphatase type 2/haloperoxidase domain-containing protein n=1 Tax=Monodon monoceros TaxID=40151 RepID=A0A4U1F9P5_MONMO|nr:hypothetical protein EI555_003389 [Monodon monoceros]
MAELLWSLQDSQLVARFQRRCGLFPAPDEGPGEPCAGPAEGAARAPGLGHLPAAKGRGAGEPASGLRRVAVPQHPRGSRDTPLFNSVWFLVSAANPCALTISDASGSSVLVTQRFPETVFCEKKREPHFPHFGIFSEFCVLRFASSADSVFQAQSSNSDDEAALCRVVRSISWFRSCMASKMRCKKKMGNVGFCGWLAVRRKVGLCMILTFVCSTFPKTEGTNSLNGHHFGCDIYPVLVMYIGQVAKDVLKWPRPFSPPVVKLEKRVIAEYGMPSTHAMAATAISFTLLISTTDRYQYPFVLGLMTAVAFSTLDVLGGILITAILIVLTYPAWTLIDRLDSASPLFPVCVLVVPFFLCYSYPVSDYYSPTRGDTTTIMAAGAGVTIGFWINHFFQLVSKPTESLPVIQNIPPLTSDLLVLGLTKFTVGIVLILLVRQLVQNLSLQVLYSWFKVVTRNKEARQRLEIEVPYKFVTYTSVGICATTFVPMLHRFLGLL